MSNQTKNMADDDRQPRNSRILYPKTGRNFTKLPQTPIQRLQLREVIMPFFAG